MAWYLYTAIIAAGFLAGFINTLAGSGSLVTLPLLIFIGLPANVANGTNRVAIPPELGSLAYLSRLWVNRNPSLSGALPSSLTNLGLSGRYDSFYFDNTGLCEPQDAPFQAWLGGIYDLQRTGVLCSP